MSDSPPEPRCFFSVKVAPRASFNRLQCAAGRIKAWVTAPPIGGEANEAVTKMLAKKLGIAPSRVELVSGASSRAKLFKVDGLSQEEADSRL